MKLRVMMLACALALSGCAQHAARERLGIEDATVLKTGVGASQDEAAGAPTSQWVNTYAPITSSRAALTSLQQRLDQLPGDKRSYFHAKAQCWINVGRETWQANDHWGFLEEAIGQAAMITMGLENGTSLSAANPALRTVSTVRPDLWKIVNVIKSDPATARCPEAQQPLACAEVELIHAGHDAWTRNFPAAEKALPGIQRELQKSAEAALQCAPPQKHAPVAPEKITLRADSAFRFDSGDEAGMLPGGKEQLDKVMAGLQQVKGFVQLNVNGYTDRLGSDAHNQKLSLQRAQTVRDYLRKRGVTLPITAQGRGKANQLTECAQMKRDELVKCLAPNRRVEIEFVRGQD
ncbi:OmpA family protein [Paraburkholderia domus]|uniref:OmpA family protein n=1 Tax=Paraburkholderia domus TaxID=2793075 RepID=UPI001B18C418|nr:OmpA family protein [Paraburkholderia domus]CAE6739074.1 Outer membrane protein A [Paraburkholderia domus]